MNDLLKNAALHIEDDQLLERSRWYGPNLITFLATSEETGRAYSLLKCVLRKGFEPPLHIHTLEDESYVILDGEITYEVGERLIHARSGDFVFLPRNVQHSFRIVTDTVTKLLLITPGGFEEMFMQFSRPALSMELPPVPTERPGKEFFERMEKLNTEMGVTVVPQL